MKMSNPKQLQLFLMPTPGAKPEFLATIEGTSKTPLDSSLPDKIVLENYTRDPWAWKPNPSVWQSFQVTSVDGRNKLPGFLKYLKDRQKSAYGRFADKEAMWVISYIQKGVPGAAEGQTMMECRMSWDLSTIPGCPMKPPAPPPQAQPKQPPAQPVVKPANKPPIRKGGFGLLGKFVSSQQRTNAHISVATSKGKPEASGAAGGGADSGGGADNGASGGTKTAQQVMAEFRTSMEQKMLDFDLAPETILKVNVSVAELQKDLATLEDKAKITMEILKYIVYEQAEEVNEEWIAHKEPSEFMDEVTIAVYKEGYAPPDVLEDMNKGELPDEVRGQQKAMEIERQRQAEIKAKIREKELTRKALAERAEDDDDEGGGASALNQKKRDRRTIEEVQREREMEAKRMRS